MEIDEIEKAYKQSHRGFKEVHALTYRAGKCYKLGSTYGGVFTPPVEDVNGTYTPGADEFTLYFQLWRWNEETDSGAWRGHYVSFANPVEMEKWRSFCTSHYDNTPNAGKLMQALSQS